MERLYLLHNGSMGNLLLHRRKSFRGGTPNGLLNGLISHYSLADATDDEGNHNGTGTNMTYGSSYGKVGDGGDFDGTARIDLGATIKNALVTAGKWSVSARIKTSTANGGIITGGKGNIYIGWLFGFDVSLGKARVAMPQSSSAFLLSSTNSVDDGAWHHVVGTFDGTTVSIYVDNGTPNTSTCSWFTGQTSGSYQANTFLGCANSNTPGNYQTGQLDQVGIWDVELDSDDVAALYNSGDGLAYSSFTV